MRCPKCKSGKIVVVNTESSYSSFTYRFRKCKACLCFWQTKEIVVEGTIKKLKIELESSDERGRRDNEFINSVW